MDRMKQCEFIRVGRLLATLMVTLPAVAHPSQAEDVMSIKFGTSAVGTLPPSFSGLDRPRQGRRLDGA